jgi:hypothetical protein
VPHPVTARSGMSRVWDRPLDLWVLQPRRPEWWTNMEDLPSSPE